MQHDNEIDKLFRDKLEEAHMPEIPQGYLDDINKRLDHLPSQKKKRRYLDFFGLVALLGIASTIFVTFYYNEISQQPKNDDSLSVNSLGNTTNEISPINSNSRTKDTNYKNEHHTILKTNDPSTSTNISEENKTTEERHNVDKTKPASTTLNSRPSASSLSKNNNNKVDRESEIILKNQRTAQNIIIQSKSLSENKKNNITKESDFSKIENKPISNKINAEQNLSITKNNIAHNNDAKINENKNGKSTIENKVDSNLSPTEKNKIVGSNTTIDNISQVDTTNSLTIQKGLSPASIANPDSLKKVTKDTLALAAKDSSKKTSPDTSKPSVITAKSDITKGVMSIQLLIGMNKVYSSFKQKNSIYNNKRKQEESPIWVYDASLLFDYTRKRFVYSVGLNYSQWGEKINYKPTTDSVSYINRYDTTYVTKQTNTNTFVTNGYISAEYKNKAVINDKLTAHNGINIYSYFSIPFLLGYKLGDEFFSVTPKIGGMAGIPIQSKGYYINNDLTELVQEKAAPWLINLQGSLDLQSKLGPYINLCITPVYRYNLTPLIHSENTVNQYAGIGMNVGLSYIIH